MLSINILRVFYWSRTKFSIILQLSVVTGNVLALVHDAVFSMCINAIFCATFGTQKYVRHYSTIYWYRTSFSFWDLGINAGSFMYSMNCLREVRLRTAASPKGTETCDRIK